MSTEGTDNDELKRVFNNRYVTVSPLGMGEPELERNADKRDYCTEGFSDLRYIYFHLESEFSTYTLQTSLELYHPQIFMHHHPTH